VLYPVSVVGLRIRGLCSPAVSDERSLLFWDVAPLLVWGLKTKPAHRIVRLHNVTTPLVYRGIKRYRDLPMGSSKGLKPKYAKTNRRWLQPHHALQYLQ